MIELGFIDGNSQCLIAVLCWRSYPRKLDLPWNLEILQKTSRADWHRMYQTAEDQNKLWNRPPSRRTIQVPPIAGTLLCPMINRGQWSCRRAGEHKKEWQSSENISLFSVRKKKDFFLFKNSEMKTKQIKTEKVVLLVVNCLVCLSS